MTPLLQRGLTIPLQTYCQKFQANLHISLDFTVIQTEQIGVKR